MQGDLFDLELLATPWPIRRASPSTEPCWPSPGLACAWRGWAAIRGNQRWRSGL